MSELGMEQREESAAISRCHQLYPGSRENFIQCLCGHVQGLCRTAGSQPPPTAITAMTPTATTLVTASTTTTPFVPTDWTRSYSVTAGLCALFLAMCAVIIVLRVMSRRNDPPTQNRVSVSTVPVPDSDPPPYEVVVRLPPSYISREPPPYCEIDVDKFPSPLICPRVAAHGQPATATSDPEAATSDQETATSGGQAANSSPGASTSDLEAAGAAPEAQTSVAEVSEVSELRETDTAPGRGNETAS